MSSSARVPTFVIAFADRRGDGPAVHSDLTHITDDPANRRMIMQRLRLKADGRIVEIRDGKEFPLAPSMPVASAAPNRVAKSAPAAASSATEPEVRSLRQRARLTQ